MTTQVRAIGAFPQRSLVDRAPFFYGWVIWVAATVGIVVSAPAQAFSYSLFIDHYITDFAIDRQTVSGLFGLGTFIAALSLTWVGRQIDRRGSRLVGFVVGVLFTLALITSALVTGPFTLLLSFIAMRTLGHGAMVLVGTTAIGKWWRIKRGWVIGLALVVSALFQTEYLHTLQRLIDAVGWRWTWVILAGMVAIAFLPVWWSLMRDRPEQFGLLPDATPVTSREAMMTTAELFPVTAEDNWTLKEARRLPIFWVFVIGRFFSSAWGSGLVLHQVSIFGAQGHNSVTVASAYGLLAIANAGVTLFVGRTIHRFRLSWMMSFQIMMMVTTLALAMTMREMWMVYAYAIVFGIVFALGGILDNNIWAEMFGREHLGAIRGFTATFLIFGTSSGPWVFGWTYDLFGGYDFILLFGIVLGILPMILGMTINKPRAHYPSEK
ncbi:MAG: MFS transporter [bacterium]|nr:MFS transporter [bacterium]